MSNPSRVLCFTALILTLTTLSEACGQDIRLSTSKAVYRLGDTINVSAEVMNARDETVNFVVEAVMKDLGSRGPSYPIQRTVGLGPKETLHLSLFVIPVDEKIYSGPFVVQARLIEGRFAVDQNEMYFEVQGALEDMDIQIILCGDPACQERSLIFIRNEKVYIRYTSDPEGVLVLACVVLPDGDEIQIDLPANLTVKQSGSYFLKLNASKEGYRNLSLTRNFAVLEVEPGIADAEKKPSSLTLQTSKAETTGGEGVVLKGELFPVHAGANVTLRYIREGRSYSQKIVITDDEGRFEDVFKPEAARDLWDLWKLIIPKTTRWSVMASWEGDSNHEGAESHEVSFTTQAEVRMDLIVLVIIGVILLILVVAAASRRRRG